jgi:hypothetical protein
MEDIEDMPTFSHEVKNTLPRLLTQIVSKATSPEDADLLLLGSLSVFSACLPNVFDNYGGREVFFQSIFVWQRKAYTLSAFGATHSRQLRQAVTLSSVLFKSP